MTSQERDGSPIIGTMLFGTGEEIGVVRHVLFDDVTGRPTWATVPTGRLGALESLVPIIGAQFDDEVLRVPFEPDVIRTAPHVDVIEGSLAEQEEQQLLRHYGVDSVAGRVVGTQEAYGGKPEQP